MHQSENIQALSTPALFKWLGAFLAAFWVSIPSPIHFLLGFMALDYFTGLVAGAILREISSVIAWRGLMKKTLTLVLLTTLYLAEREAGFGLQVTTMAALGYVVNEVISIFENCARAGVPIPPKLIVVLLTVQKLRGSKPEVMAKKKGVGE